jgi:hypothetical protein
MRTLYFTLDWRRIFGDDCHDLPPEKHINAHEVTYFGNPRDVCFTFGPENFLAFSNLVVGRIGIEPITNGLRVHCSTN